MIHELLSWLNLTNGWHSLFDLYKSGIVICIPVALVSADKVWRDEVQSRGYRHTTLVLFTLCMLVAMPVALIIWPVGFYWPKLRRK